MRMAAVLYAQYGTHSYRPFPPVHRFLMPTPYYHQPPTTTTTTTTTNSATSHSGHKFRVFHVVSARSNKSPNFTTVVVRWWCVVRTTFISVAIWLFSHSSIFRALRTCTVPNDMCVVLIGTSFVCRPQRNNRWRRASPRKTSICTGRFANAPPLPSSVAATSTAHWALRPAGHIRRTA